MNLRERTLAGAHLFVVPTQPSMSERAYEGTELDLFAKAVRWKDYWLRLIEPYVSGHTLEVGSGCGNNTLMLSELGSFPITCMEPDPGLVDRLTELLDEHSLLARCSVRTGTTADLNESDVFDTIVYLDVLEHIEDDREELRRIASHLSGGGALIVLSPAYDFLFSPFDTAIGHHRRYTSAKLRNIAPPGLVETKMCYLDSVGLSASLVNRMFLRQSMPTAEQLRVWDQLLVPMSRVVDPLIFHAFGKTILAVWRKSE